MVAAFGIMPCKHKYLEESGEKKERGRRKKLVSYLA